MNILKFDAKKAESLILDYYKSHIKELADGFAKVLGEEFGNDQVALRGPWIEKAINDIMILEPKNENGYVYCEVGWDYDSLWEEVRVRVGMYGSGSQNHEEGNPNAGIRLWTKPGEAVWDGAFEGDKEESRAKELRLLPEAFNRPGNDALENAKKAFKPIFDQQVKIIIENAPIQEIFNACFG